MRFDLIDLRLLVAIADSGSLSRAAAEFPLALSAASNRLRQLEDRLGLELFSRHADGMTPTPAGRVAIDHARRVLAQAGHLNQELDALAGRRRIRIRLAVNTVANSTFLPTALGPFLGDFPEVDLDIDERSSKDIPQALLDDEADIGVMDGNLPAHGIVSLPFRQDRLVLFAPAGHPLAARASCMFREALAYPFVGMPAGRALQHFIEEMALQSGKPLAVRVRTPGFFTIAQLVEHGTGLAVLPEAAARRHAQAMAAKVVLLEDLWATRELRLCVRSMEALSAQARQLVAYLATMKPDSAA